MPPQSHQTTTTSPSGIVDSKFLNDGPDSSERTASTAATSTTTVAADVNGSSSSSSSSLLSYAQQRVYSKEDLHLFNLLDSPMWIFDNENKSMLWANDAGCGVWEAPDVESLCARDFAADMTKTTARAMKAWLERFAKGERIPVTWTIHPDGGKNGPKTCEIIISGIYVSFKGDCSDTPTSDSAEDDSEGHLCMLVHVKRVISGKTREPENATTIRRTEMLRHFPIVARQFNFEGKLMDQNPQAYAIFGIPFNGPQPETESRNTDPNNDQDPSGEQQQQQQYQQQTSPGTLPDDSTRSSSSSLWDASTRSTASPHLCDFLDQFSDLNEGRQVFEEVREGHDYSTEIQQITLEGPKWFSVNVRRIQDPVTSEPVIIYSGRDITKVMEAAKLEADKQNMKRNEFFAVMAHEIRTPLHQVVGFIELLASSSLNTEQTESVDMLQSSAHALMAIINDLLDFTKLEAGKMKLETIPFEVRGVLDCSVAAVQPQVHEKPGLVVKCNVDQNIPIKLLGDPNRLRQIVLNMLSNAVKFTKTGEIIVESHRIKKDNGQMTVRFSVKDSGIGIPKDKCDRIFNPYQQADASVSRNFGGTGLGLAICKSLCENMGGSIGVDSELGKGATFWFEIPFGIFVNHHHEVNDHDSHSADDLSSFNVLVAEDNKVNQKVVCKMLKRLGHEVKIVENGKAAVEEIVNHQHEKCYDIILMDWQMPVMDGIDATKEIRRKGFSPAELPIVGLTASIQGLDWSEIGMNDCLKKPIRIPDLKAGLLKNVLG